jgi:hypothetical protein
MVEWKGMWNLLGEPRKITKHGYSHDDIYKQKIDVIEGRGLMVGNLASSSGCFCFQFLPHNNPTIRRYKPTTCAGENVHKVESQLTNIMCF